jgi:hypothetical protein
MSKIIEYKPDPFCDFCGRGAEHSDYMVVSQRTWRACICDDCVLKIAEMLAEKMGGKIDDGRAEGKASAPDSHEAERH